MTKFQGPEHSNYLDLENAEQSSWNDRLRVAREYQGLSDPTFFTVQSTLKITSPKSNTAMLLDAELNRGPSVLRVPAEILTMVLSRLPLKERCAARRVCKAWDRSEAVSPASSWNSVAFSTGDERWSPPLLNVSTPRALGHLLERSAGCGLYLILHISYDISESTVIDVLLHARQHLHRCVYLDLRWEYDLSETPHVCNTLRELLVTPALRMKVLTVYDEALGIEQCFNAVIGSPPPALFAGYAPRLVTLDTTSVMAWPTFRSSGKTLQNIQSAQLHISGPASLTQIQELLNLFSSVIDLILGFEDWLHTSSVGGTNMLLLPCSLRSLELNAADSDVETILPLLDYLDGTVPVLCISSAQGYPCAADLTRLYSCGTKPFKPRGADISFYEDDIALEGDFEGLHLELYDREYEVETTRPLWDHDAACQLDQPRWGDRIAHRYMDVLPTAVASCLVWLEVQEFVFSQDIMKHPLPELPSLKYLTVTLAPLYIHRSGNYTGAFIAQATDSLLGLTCPVLSTLTIAAVHRLYGQWTLDIVPRLNPSVINWFVVNLLHYGNRQLASLRFVGFHMEVSAMEAAQLEQLLNLASSVEWEENLMVRDVNTFANIGH